MTFSRGGHTSTPAPGAGKRPAAAASAGVEAVRSLYLSLYRHLAGSPADPCGCPGN